MTDPTDAAPLLSLRGVGKDFEDRQGGRVVAVDEVDLEVAAGETVALIGTSGSGKTTLLRMINRLIEPSRGSIRLEDRNVFALDPIRLRRRIGYVIQKGGLFPHMTVERNCGLMCRLEGWSEEKTRRRVHELLDLVNLPHAEFAHRHPDELSGGQRQRIGVARALALDPAIILMDEPFSALDPITRGQLHDEFLSLEEDVGKTVVIVTHDLAEAFKLAGRIVVMNEGRIVQIGSESDLRERPASEFVRRFVEDQSAGLSA